MTEGQDIGSSWQPCRRYLPSQLVRCQRPRGEEEAATPEEDKAELQEVRKRLFARWPEPRNPLDSETSASPFSPAVSWAGAAPHAGLTATPSPAPELFADLEGATPERHRQAPAWTPAAAASAAQAAANASPCTDDRLAEALWRRLVERPLPSAQPSREGDDAKSSLNSEEMKVAVDTSCSRCGHGYAVDSLCCRHCGQKRGFSEVLDRHPADLADEADGEVRVVDPVPTEEASVSQRRHATAGVGAGSVGNSKFDVGDAAEALLLRRRLFGEQASPSIKEGHTAESSARSQSTSKMCQAADASALASELRLEEPSLVHEFEQLNGQLRRHGFHEVPHHLEPLPEPESGALTHIVTDARSLWGTCTEVLLAYAERGRRIQDALLAERTEERQRRDGRIRSLVLENTKLQEEMKAVKAEASARTRTPSVTAGSPPPSAGTSFASSPSRPSPSGPPHVAERRDREMAELALRARAAEASARHREKELEKLRARLEQALAEASRRQEREREALARPLRKKGVGGRGEEALLEAAVAHKARSESLQADIAALNKQVHVLSFRLEEADDKLRQAEAQKTRQPQAFAQVAPAAQADSGNTATVEELERAKLRLAQAEEQLARQQERHASEVTSLTGSLRKMEDQLEHLRGELRSKGREPSASELRWQKEALRLRDELAEVRKLWKTVDSRGLMKRDKELCRLGLDARAVEETVPKSDLVSTLLELCRLLQLKDIASVLPEVSALLGRKRVEQESVALHPVHEPAAGSLEELGRGTLEALQELGGNALPPQEALVRLRTLCASEADARRHRLLGQSTFGEASAAAQPSQDVWRQVSRLLELPEGAHAEECRAAIEGLKGKARQETSLLTSLAGTLRCQKDDLQGRGEALVRLCDERLAAHRIVEALQKLLVVDDITEVLPALKQVLDVAALRRKAGVLLLFGTQAVQTDNSSEA
eukprot:TRINITY_DN39599_c0_g1_i2.p1 TRINITY_DN39599_c0_g1~~TRINITY_DN39599_c0_g1_i2.p1  ORF type:complete len:947 (+),score=250.47 TRINITY_DN39599_c0_g1_i2:49-2889(+)